MSAKNSEALSRLDAPEKSKNEGESAAKSIAPAHPNPLHGLVDLTIEGYSFAKLQAKVTAKRLDLIAPAGAHPTIASAISDLRFGHGLTPVNLVITATGREAEDLAASLRALEPTAEVIEFPSWETLPHERLSPSAETVGRRVRALRRLHEVATSQETLDHPIFVLASIRAALQPIVAGLGEREPVTLEQGREYSLFELPLKLIDFAYERVDMVTKRGEFAVRGGILDVFPTTAEHAYRLEFFGDEIEEIRLFAVADQRTLHGETAHVAGADEHGRVKALPIYPARELLITPDVANRARQMLHEFPNISTMLAKIAEGIPVEGMESLAPALAEKLSPLTDALPADASVVLIAPEKAAARAASLVETNEEFLHAAWDAATEGAQAPIDLSAGGFIDLSQFKDALDGRQLVTISQFGADDESLIDLGLLEIPTFVGADGQRETSILDWIRDQVANNQRVLITAEGHGTIERITEMLKAQGLKAELQDQMPGDHNKRKWPAAAVVTIQATLRRGFAAPEANLIVLTEQEFFGRNAAYLNPERRRLAAKRGQAVDPLNLRSGDYVVHEIHGIGRFKELVTRQAGVGTQKHEREYLLIEYAPSKRGYPGDTLYVPTDQLDMLTRYVGGEAPVLNKMGGTEWAKVKGNARKAIRKIAIDLVKLYSTRVKSKGHAFGPDTAWQRELEEAFAHVETPDQLTTIDEVKRDMEREIPMDRLLAGDVGYGKTEVAVRAAFKAIQDGKQVAMLVPTTLLARQHFETFTARYAGFPVNVRQLSRFQSDKEAKETLAGMADGTVDLVIGTHRIIANSVKFRNLGLIIIDEEQRFGVEHKEKLKDLKHNVDVLAMSATPIPRTLEMAITGIREMSTLATPPEERHPILTYIGGYSEKQVAAAIRRELIREGQVFFVHNRVQSIDKVAKDLAELVPEARIAVAHGQMGEHELEQVVVDFWQKKFDVLVSTTIIETGIDIPNANTLIIDRAENFGLSQLHQIRGRVGRSRERAYAYFFYSPDKPLTETAHDRLATIAQNNELGSGMQVAMKDLEIRGAGNLLGGEQSGHIAGVGFDLYLRMIGEAVADFKGEKVESPAELKLELPVDAHIPGTYVDSERLRLEAYHKLSAASGELGTKAQLDAILAELNDRYGEPPEAVMNLVAVTELRQQANRLGLKDVNILGLQAKFQPVTLVESDQVRLSHLFPGLKYLASASTLMLPAPRDPATGEPLRDQAVIDWTWAVLARVFPQQ
ncbi:MAG: transcription-repair coupling factor [Actinomycetota bacterium]|jgi:transcription-repair coupling factor (superfamily II helicase)